MSCPRFGSSLLRTRAGGRAGGGPRAGPPGSASPRPRRRTRAIPAAARRPASSRRRWGRGTSRCGSASRGAPPTTRIASTSGASAPQQRVLGGEPVPGGEVELAFGHPGGARVAGDDAAERRVEEEEGDRDRDLQLRPLRLGQRGRRVMAHPVGHRAVAAAGPGEQQRARPAGAGDRPVLQVHHVRVLGRPTCSPHSSQRSPPARSGAGPRPGRGEPAQRRRLPSPVISAPAGRRADLQQRRLARRELHAGRFRRGVGDRLLHDRGRGAAAVAEPDVHHARVVDAEELRARAQAGRARA